MNSLQFFSFVFASIISPVFLWLHYTTTNNSTLYHRLTTPPPLQHYHITPLPQNHFFQDLKEQVDQLTKELERLRHHLMSIEATHDNELLDSTQENDKLTQQLKQLQQHLSSSVAVQDNTRCCFYVLYARINFFSVHLFILFAYTI